MIRRPPFPGAIALFDQPEEARVGPVRQPSTSPASAWTDRFKPARRIACDHCVIYLHEHGGVGPLPLSARHRRKAGEEDLRLCTPHANVLRKRDGLKLYGGGEMPG